MQINNRKKAPPLAGEGRCPKDGGEQKPITIAQLADPCHLDRAKRRDVLLKACPKKSQKHLIEISHTRFDMTKTAKERIGKTFGFATRDLLLLILSNPCLVCLSTLDLVAARVYEHDAGVLIVAL